MNIRGFTVVEIIITVTIMGILLAVGAFSWNTAQLQARDGERTADVEAIQVSLESWYRTGVTGQLSTITNLIPNPSFETNTSSVQMYSGATLTRVASPSAASGSYVGRILRGTAGGSAILALVYPIAYQPNTIISIRMKVRLSPGSPTTNSIDMFIGAYNSGSLIGTATKPGSLTTIRLSSLSTTSWTDVAMEGYTTPNNPNVNRVGIWLQSNQTWAATDGIEIDGMMLVKEAAAAPFADGNSPGWAWSGAQNISTSSGPVITDSNGSYPTLLSTHNSILETYFPNTDMKVFMPPGQTDTAISFIRATNATQTEAGVLPQPTVNQYVYQPIDSNGGLCQTGECRKYNLYYRLEKDNTVYKVTSKNQ